MSMVVGARDGQQRGQSMLEAIIACGIIVTAIASSLTLVQSAITGSKDSETSITAANLAREGVEVARAQRDSNWLKGAAFDAGLYSGSDYTAIATFTPTTNAWTLNYAAANATTDAAAKVYRHTGVALGSTNGLMVQAVSQPADTTRTIFSRIVTTEPMCESGTGAMSVVTSGTDCGAQAKVGIRVLSKVTWQLGGRTRAAQAEERMYDWR